jgi:glucose/arabinose dehydrogenase/cytochrome c2
MASKNSLRRTPRPAVTLLAVLAAVGSTAQVAPVGDPGRGQAYFQLSCAVCHSPGLGPNNTVIIKQGPSLLGVTGRKAGSSPHFNYTKAMRESGLTWDAATLNRFLASPMTVLPGTTMPMPVPNDVNRADVIAYLSTLTIPDGVTLNYQVISTPSNAGTDVNDWQRQMPGMQHHFTEADLPAPFATSSAGNGPQVVPPPANAMLSVPQGFAVRKYADGMNNPRLLRVAPNGDIFIAETGPGRLRVMRAADGAESPAENQIFADGLDRPFGVAFYPVGENPQWLYVANNNSVVRFAYHNGDLKAKGAPEIIVPRLTESTGGHTTRDVAFSRDGRRMFISVGSGSNVAEGMKKKTPEEIRTWEAENGPGAAWDGETHRAEILVTDPDGHQPLRAYATGIRNGVGLAVNEQTGDLWVSTNERDGLGDNLVPDYVTRIKEGGYYGWPWYYLGNHEEPRHAGERPDLAGQAIVPDVLEQSHSASLEMTFYTATNGIAAFPAEYRGDAFVAFHGSWNRNTRTGYKVVRVRVDHGVPTGEYDDFLTGFVVDQRSVWGRPVGVTVAHDGALLLTEDGNGTLWRVAYGSGGR